jgi:hypothetical protein
MDKIRNNVLDIMENLEKLSEHDYRTFELALALFLRSDRHTVKYYVTDNELETLDRIIYDSEYFMSDDLKEEIDSILESEED